LPTPSLPSAIQPAAAPEKLAALPPNETPAPRATTVVPDKPAITVIRGGRQSTIPPRARATAKAEEKSKFAALPPSSSSGPTVTDAPPIIVLRGGRGMRYALAGRVESPQPAVHPLLTVIRGARPQRVRLVPYVQPGPLILRIPN
jgi:hypothetical protein